MTDLFSAGFFRLLWVQRLVCLTACYMQILLCFNCIQSDPRQYSLCCSAWSARKGVGLGFLCLESCYYYDYDYHYDDYYILLKSLLYDFLAAGDSMKQRVNTLKFHIQAKFKEKCSTQTVNKAIIAVCRQTFDFVAARWTPMKCFA